jgi:hypothetical protein
VPKIIFVIILSFKPCDRIVYSWRHFSPMEETFIQNTLKRAHKKILKGVSKNVKKIVTKINAITDHGLPIDTSRYFVNPLKPLCTTGFKYSASCPHDVLLCFYGCQNKQIISL